MYFKNKIQSIKSHYDPVILDFTHRERYFLHRDRRVHLEGNSFLELTVMVLQNNFWRPYSKVYISWTNRSLLDQTAAALKNRMHSEWGGHKKLAGQTLKFTSNWTILRKIFFPPQSKPMSEEPGGHAYSNTANGRAQAAIRRAPGPLAPRQPLTGRQRFCTVSTHFY